MSVSLSMTGPDFARLSAELRGADKRIQREMRKAIRKAGEDTVRDVRTAIMAVPSSGRSGTGVRAALAAGTNVSISARGRTAGVTLKTSPSRLPADKRVLARAFNKTFFRHPVYPDPTKPRSDWGWANQPGNPYFGAVIGEHYAQMRSGVYAAMVVAQRQLAAEIGKA